MKTDPPASEPSPAPSTTSEGRPRFLVTAGPTWEPVDEVRYLGNRSSGRMGVEIARAAALSGHPTTLLLGPGTNEPAGSVTSAIGIQRFQSAADLDTLLRDCWPAHDILVMAAAVADHRPVRHPDMPRKLRRADRAAAIELEPVPDLLAGLAEVPHPGTRIGFALEPGDELEASARRKLAAKRLHGIVGNPLETMESDRIDGRLFLPDGTERRPAAGSCPKPAFAKWLVESIAPLHRRRAP